MDNLYGKCTLSVKFNNHGEYLKCKQYLGNNRWDFITSYPAIMRYEFEFHTVLDVEILARKIVQLLQVGLTVYSANWQLKEYKSQLK